MSDAFHLPAAAVFDRQSPDIVVPQQQAVKVIANANGDVAIIQAADWDEEEDRVIDLAPVHAEALARAILRVAAQATEDDDLRERLKASESVLGQTFKTSGVPSSRNAERQARYRERRRGDVTSDGDGDAERNGGVTS